MYNLKLIFEDIPGKLYCLFIAQGDNEEWRLYYETLTNNCTIPNQKPKKL